MNSSLPTSFITTLNNTSAFTECGGSDSHQISRIPDLAFTGILFVFGTFGNGHAIILNIQRFREQKSSRNRKDPYVTFVLSLAMIDMLICAFVLPLDFVDNFLKFTLLVEDLCKTYRYLQYSFHMSSVLHVVLICIHCWRRVCFPNRRQIERRLAIRLCVVCSIVAFLLGLPSFAIFGYSTITFDDKRGHICYTDDAYKGSLLLKICMGYIGSGLVISLIIIFISYIALFRYRLKHRMERRNSNEKSTKREKESGKTTPTLVILTLVFVVSYIPYMILASLAGLKKDFRQEMDLQTLAAYRVFVTFPYLKNVLNPVVYGFTDQDFRKRLRQMYTRFVHKLSFSKVQERQIEISL